jgi:hypothetical protein
MTLTRPVELPEATEMRGLPDKKAWKRMLPAFSSLPFDKTA